MPKLANSIGAMIWCALRPAAFIATTSLFWFSVASVMIVASSVNFIDLAGAEMLAQEAKRRREIGGGLYFYRLKGNVRDVLVRSKRLAEIGERAVSGHARPTDPTLLADLSTDIVASALCGHERAAVLDGGITAWRSEGRALEAGRRATLADAWAVWRSLDSRLVVFGVLLALAERLTATVRPGDTVARFGGDEFTALLPMIDEPLDAVTVAQTEAAKPTTTPSATGTSIPARRSFKSRQAFLKKPYDIEDLRRTLGALII